jgi:predicted DNA repair protein MutK
MAKNKGGFSREFLILAGAVLLLIAFVGIGKILTLLLVLLGAYLIYQGVKKK